MGVFATKHVGALILAAALCAGAPAADLPFARTGTLSGFVVDPTGAPQMGASIQLFDSLGKLVAHTASTANGEFAFLSLPASLYSIRVTFADYLPATRERIAINGGMNSLLQIHLATLMSSVELQYKLPTAGMSNNWKWVLRSSPATRPVTRFRSVDASASDDPRTPVFSGTHAAFSVAGGDVNIADPDYAGSDVGTGFALSTKVFGKNQLAVSGSVAQNSAFNPSAMGLSATYKRAGDVFGSTPEIRVTMEQIGVLNGPNEAAVATGSATTAVRTMEVSVYQAIDLGGAARVEYGLTGQTVDYFTRSTHASPFARVTRSLGSAGEVVLAFSDGARPNDLRAHQSGLGDESGETSEEPASATNALARVPELSYSNDRLKIQRTLTYEAGYQKTRGRQTIAVSAFSEDVSNGRVDVAGNTAGLNAGNLMWDGVSSTSIYNIGSYSRTGVLASADERVTDWLAIEGGFGRMGALLANDTGESGSSRLSGLLTEESRDIATAAVRARLPRTRTKLITNYGWTDCRGVIPQHVFTTQNAYVSPGLNVIIRQPLPSLFGMPGRIELDADVRNLLAQGYVPLNGGGQNLLMVQTPRLVRGGVNFTF